LAWRMIWNAVANRYDALATITKAKSQR